MIALRDTALDPAALLAAVADPEHGGTALFVGTTRAESGLREVAELRYEAYEELALSEMRAIATEVALAPPDPDGPGMFRCAAPGYVGALYEGAGLRDVAEWDVAVELVTRSPAQYWEMISEHASVAAAVGLAGKSPAEVFGELRERKNKG